MARHRLKRFSSRIGLLMIAIMVTAALFAPLIAPYSPLVQHVDASLTAPGTTFWLGTDEFGRDVLSRIIYGARTTLLVGMFGVALGGIVGIVTGLFAGYFEGRWDRISGGLCDVVLAFPSVLLAIIIAALLGASSLTVGMAVAIINIPIFARLTRSSIISEKHREYVSAAIIVGASSSRVMFRHLLPNATGPLFVQSSVAMAHAILLEAGLSFLGLGTQPPFPSWGGMLHEAQDYLALAPWYTVFPGVMILCLVLALNLAADGLSDIFDPRLSV